MDNTVVRLEALTIENFKNVKKGHLTFANSRKPYKTSILGLYGQNGSGKTALIDALDLLRYALTGQAIPIKFADYIHVESDSASFSYEFSLVQSKIRYRAFYEFKLKSERVETEKNLEDTVEEETYYKPVITEEILSYSYEDDERKIKIRKSPLIDTNTSSDSKTLKAFVPLGKYSCLVGNDKEKGLDLIIHKKMAMGISKSFIFSRELLTAIRNNTESYKDLEFQRHMLLVESLVRYGNFELFVINTENTGIISMNMLPISFKYENRAKGAVGNILIPLEDANPIPEDAVSMVEHVLRSMNIVLSKIVPHLTIQMESLGESISSNGEKVIKIQLMSLKNKKAIPLKCESEGIKKIISILQLLIVVYNHTSITVAIDELDSGVFEYLLGELLRVISEKGKGQLIFTSHNLRPLETLDRGFIAFTTINPCNRYIRMNNLKDSNNLRDFYYRDIILGEQSEEVYDATDNAEIALAFREAGEWLVEK